MLGLTRVLAKEWAAKGINVNAVAPGYVASNSTIALRADPDRSAGILARIPAGRWASPPTSRGPSHFSSLSLPTTFTAEITMTETNFRCGLEAALEILGGKWKPLILFHLASGTKRTGQLRRLVTNVSEKIQHLKEMVDDGVIRRIDFRTVPPHVEYELTDFGHSLAKVLAPLCEWGTRHSSEVAIIVQNRNRASEAA